MATKKGKSKGGADPFQPPKGMRDILPAEQPWWERVRKAARDLAESYDFSRIDVPVLEDLSLFARGIGEETDVVGKEMYTVKTKGDTLALRPEFTSGIMRAYLGHHLGRLAQPQKLFAMGPAFRHENPQLGRTRQFTQIDFEVIGGTTDPLYDAEIITVFARLLEELKIKHVSLKVNSIGCRVCRPAYRRQLQNYYKGAEKKICGDCQRRLKTNPLRLLDCTQEGCRAVRGKAPSVLDKLCGGCSGHLKGVLEYLDEMAIPYLLDHALVRGLDYYSRTVFEFVAEGPAGDIGALPAGGRYDYLAEMIGNRPTPAVGGAVSIERLVAVMQMQEVKFPVRIARKVFFVHVGELAKRKSLRIIEELRHAGIGVVEALGRDSLRAQFKTADKEGLEFALIFGQREIFEESIIIRDLTTGLQESVPLGTLVEEMKKRFRAQAASPTTHG